MTVNDDLRHIIAILAELLGYPPRPCGHCGQPFNPGSATARYCTPGCKDAAGRARRGHQPRTPAADLPHGTPAGAQRHYRAGQKPCPPCLAAHRSDRAARAGRDGGETRTWDPRPRRNGLPPFKPYIYRGTIHDLADPWPDLQEAS